MALSSSIQGILALARVTSIDDDDAVDDLGRRILEAIIRDPDTPEDVKENAVRLLKESDDTPSTD